MKNLRLITLIAAIVITVMSLSSVVSAADDAVYVTIANGSLMLAYESVPLTDIDGDGALTVNDALIAAHDAAFEGGAEAGFASADTEFGLSMTKLWGNDSGSFGYYVNNASALSLADPVKAGDHIVAYVYTDLDTWSDTYSFFDITTADGEKVTLTLSASGYDENWAPVTNPVSGAVITVDGEKTDIVTNEEGKAIVSVEDAGKHIISAVSDTMTLVPPVCVLTVTEAAPDTTPETTPDQTPDSAPPTGTEVFGLLAIAVASFGVIMLTARRRTNR